MTRRPLWKLRPRVLLGQPIPQPMHGLAPRVILGAKWWDATRRAAYKSTNYHCIACGVHKYRAKLHEWLEGHELYDIDYLLGRMVYVETVPLCHYCHNYVHSGRLQWMLETDQIPRARYVSIVQHGDQVLAEAGLRREPYEGAVADWGTWRLVLNGAEYPPLYANLKEWTKANGSGNI